MVKLRKWLVPNTQKNLIDEAENSTNELVAGQQDQDPAYVEQNE